MKLYVPDYYGKFKCIAEKCKHNCCIGWEIDIDSQSLEKYKSIGGTLGKRFAENICTDTDCPTSFSASTSVVHSLTRTICAT